MYPLELKVAVTEDDVNRIFDGETTNDNLDQLDGIEHYIIDNQDMLKGFILGISLDQCGKAIVDVNSNGEWFIVTDSMLDDYSFI